MYGNTSSVFGNHSVLPQTTSIPESSVYNSYGSFSSLTERIQTITHYIDEAIENDLYNFFVDLVYEIFGHGPSKGWKLDKLKMSVCFDLFYLYLINLFIHLFGR